MPFTTNGASYASVLDTLRDNRGSWEGAQSVAACEEAGNRVINQLVPKLFGH